MSDQTLEQLKAEKYPVKIFFDENDGVYVAEYLDLPGCSAYGDTVEDAYRGAEEAKAEWLRVTLEQGLPIPKPSKPEEYSGRILVRVPSSLHAALVDKASLHGASLNQYIVHLLSGAVVGDTANLELDELGNKVAQLEWRIAELSLYLRRNYVRGGTVVVSTAVQNVNAALCSYGLGNYVQGIVSPSLKTREGFAQVVTGLVSSDWPSADPREQHARSR